MRPVCAARGRLAPACTTSRGLEGDRPTGMYGVYNIHSHIAKSILQIPGASAFPPIIPNYLPAPAPRVNCLSFFSGGLAPFYICDLTSRNSLAENLWTCPGNTTDGVQHPEAVCPAADGPLRLRRRRRVQPRPAVRRRRQGHLQRRRERCRHLFQRGPAEEVQEDASVGL